MEDSSFCSPAGRAERIRALNDAFRQNGASSAPMEQWLVSRGVTELGANVVLAVARAVRDFSDFDEGNDPYGEHDFGAVTIYGERYFWKIDYYDRFRTTGSEDPTDEVCTTRVLTIMLASEY